MKQYTKIARNIGFALFMIIWLFLIIISCDNTKYYFYSYAFKNGNGNSFQVGRYFDFNSAKKQRFNEVGEISIISFQEITKEEFINANIN